MSSRVAVAAVRAAMFDADERNWNGEISLCRRRY
jgi:hypothetical protein